jgi:hypothetical protein
VDLRGQERASGEFSVRYRRGANKDHPLVSEMRWDGTEREIPMDYREAMRWRDLAEKKGIRVKIVRL